MHRFRHILAALGVLALGMSLTGAALAAPAASIEQVRNGTATSLTTPVPSYGTGNAGASNSHYLESHSTSYRSVMTQLPTDGTVIELIIGYDVKRSGSYALDYLTHYQRLLPHVLFGHSQPEVFDPLVGVAGVGPVVTTAPIPLPTVNLMVDPDGPDPEPAALQPLTSMAALSAPERVMTLFGGTLIDVTYVQEADVSLALKSSETRVRVRFTANSPNAVLAWGGHIGCRWDWGFNPDGTPRSAGGISGSSYHMRLVNWNLGSLGSQDRSMSTDAVYPVPRCGIGNAGPFCAGTTNTHTAPAGMESYAWSLTDNTAGAEIVGGTTGTSVVVRTSTAGSYRVVVTTGASGFTRECTATVTVMAPATADAGVDPIVCSTSPLVQLTGVVTGGAGTWNGGTGTFNPGRSDMNATYMPSAAEITAGSVTLTLTTTSTAGTCPPASDQVRVTIQRAPTANAGADLVVCATNPLAQLAGGVGGSATGGTWSGGEGTFTPNASTMNATYMPSAAEIAAGWVRLALTTTMPAGPCFATADTVRITINPPATANAGADQTVCATSPQVQLAGVVGSGAVTGTWSGGNGSFSPNASSINATYTPSAVEIAAGGVTLTLTSNDPAGPCVAANDQVRITINPAATVNAGADQTVCATSPQVQLAGVLGGGASGGTWTGGSGSFSPSASAANATYTPSAAEIAAGGVTLTFTTNDPAGPCGALGDQMRITINPAATLNAGADLRVCASSPQAHLTGVLGGSAASGTWSGGTGSFSPNASSLNATYTPSGAEIAAGGVTLTLTTNDPAGPCGAVNDQVWITIDPVTIVSAGPDQTVCSITPQVQLMGSVSGTVTTGAWTGGTGSFSPSRSSLTATYTPSAAEIAAGTVTLTLTSSASSGPCPPASDALTIVINLAPSVNAGPDQIVCAVSPQVQLMATLQNGATSAVWSGGSGTFTPSNTSLNPLYMPSAAEIAARSVTLTITTNDPAGPCPAANDQVRITIDAPTVSVTNRTICSGISPASLCATPGNGIAPYTYLWSNGATSQCISVADTGSYTVTITDARGCQATGSGAFRWRDCVGTLTHTSATCSDFMDGTADDIVDEDIHVSVRNDYITSIAPGVFFYYTKITAPSPSFTVNVVQTKDNPAFPFCPVLQGQVSRFDEQCGSMTGGIETSPGQAGIAVTGAQTGEVFILRIKYSLKELIGTYMPDSTGCHYDFRTEINGLVVDRDPEGLTIGYPRPYVDPANDAVIVPTPWRGDRLFGADDAVASEDDGLMLYRPAPNPFHSGMRMAYSVAGTGGRVRIGIFDVAGRSVATLVDGFEPAGRHTVAWDGRDAQGARLAQGVYFVHARIGEETRQVRVMFVR